MGKNQLKEVLEKMGRVLDDRAAFQRSQPSPGVWESTVSVTLPCLGTLTGKGTARRSRDADAEACAVVVEQLASVGIDWVMIRREAQAGDALLKLAAYRAVELGSVAEASRWLQRHEADRVLARLFDRHYAEGHPDLLIFGPALGEKLKATVVEALIWRRYGPMVLGEGAGQALADLRAEVASAHDADGASSA